MNGIEIIPPQANFLRKCYSEGLTDTLFQGFPRGAGGANAPLGFAKGGGGAYIFQGGGAMPLGGGGAVKYPACNNIQHFRDTGIA